MIKEFPGKKKEEEETYLKYRESRARANLVQKCFQHQRVKLILTTAQCLSLSLPSFTLVNKYSTPGAVLGAGDIAMKAKHPCSLGACVLKRKHR